MPGHGVKEARKNAVPKVLSELRLGKLDTNEGIKGKNVRFGILLTGQIIVKNPEILKSGKSANRKDSME
jgi:hypothetical protein